MEDAAPEELKQYAHKADVDDLAKTLRSLGYTKAASLNGTQISKILLAAIQETLETPREQSFDHWGNQGWWYHGTLTLDEWVLLRLKFFNR